MQAHRFDSVSALLALVAIAAGFAVAFEATDPFGDADAGVWIAVLALAAGFIVIPWGRRDRPSESDQDVEPGDISGSDLVDLDT